MESTRIKIVGMGSKGGIAMQMVADLDASGHDCTWFNAGDENFDHSKFDVRSSLSGAHWLLIEASSFGKSESAASATGAAMVFAELEGAKTVVIVDEGENMDSDRAWGSIVERIRQIGFISMTSEGRSWIARLEGVDEKSVGDLLRSRGLVSIVAILDVHTGRIEIHHSLGVETGVSDRKSMQSLVVRMLLHLPSSSYSNEGIRRSAGI
ncbi:MAG: hypothetical protein VXX59_03125 [Candidatus Thermoplasmatota archaeon]|nr:hypothetical protein [Candidatus Thermoplasmatota archaeon]GIR80593.1 MAG: hypothetical protein CM15mP82_1450 [Euryarchaeota archaeon]